MPVDPDRRVRRPLTAAAPSAALPVIEVGSAFDVPSAPGEPRPWDPHVLEAPAANQSRTGWLVVAAVAVVGLIASGTLGAAVLVTIAQRDAARYQLARADQELQARKATDAYLTLYTWHSGRVATEYQNLTACDAYIRCRIAAEHHLVYTLAFQAARSSAAVPAKLAIADRQVGQALSLSIDADEELIAGMDAGDASMVADGFKKLDAGMLGFGQAETTLAALLA
ncbi:MAG TPA: hypothetical protein VLR46_05060 [Candidatus Dormibacteraeota bacterium]|nr:hypothetical protein [Candidatus Dormibacteraeota bacterium]